MFNRYTKKSARRSWRLLILDGHGSHVTQDFIDYCDANRILLAVFPPHSTHTLQPLDVVMFKPLSSAYSAELTNYLHASQGLIAIKKGDFFPLFYRAWISSFKKETILKSFEATGIWPQESEVILRRFHQQPPDGEAAVEGSPPIDEGDWRKIRKLVQSAVKDGAEREANKITESLHHLQTQNELLLHEVGGLRDALTTKKKHQKKGTTLDLQQRKEYHGGAVFWSLRKVREARVRQSVKEQEEREEKLQKAEAKELKAAATLYKQKIAEERRVARERAKVVREEEKAEKAAQSAARREAQNAAKAIQLSQKGKRQASKPPARKPRKKQAVERHGGTAESSGGGESASEPPPKTTRRGRNVNLPSKFR